MRGTRRIKLWRVYRFMRRQVARVEWLIISAYARWVLICLGEDPLVERLKAFVQGRGWVRGRGLSRRGLAA